MKAPARPWRTSVGGRGVRTLGAKARFIAECAYAVDAAHIVKCVNMHDEFIEAIKLAEAMLVIDGHTDRNPLTSETPVLRELRRILAKAEGE